MSTRHGEDEEGLGDIGLGKVAGPCRAPRRCFATRAGPGWGSPARKTIAATAAPLGIAATGDASSGCCAGVFKRGWGISTTANDPVPHRHAPAPCPASRALLQGTAAAAPMATTAPCWAPGRRSEVAANPRARCLRELHRGFCKGALEPEPPRRPRGRRPCCRTAATEPSSCRLISRAARGDLLLITRAAVVLAGLGMIRDTEGLGG